MLLFRRLLFSFFFTYICSSLDRGNYAVVALTESGSKSRTATVCCTISARVAMNPKRIVRRMSPGTIWQWDGHDPASSLREVLHYI